MIDIGKCLKRVLQKGYSPLALHLRYPCAAKQKNPFSDTIANLLALFFYEERTLRGAYKYQRLSSAALGLLTVPEVVLPKVEYSISRPEGASDVDQRTDGDLMK